MQQLIQFLKFVEDNHLEEAAREQLRICREMDIPILRLFSHFPEEALISQTMQSIRDFVASLETNTYQQRQTENFKRWEADELPGIPKDSIEPSDLVLVYAAQKKSFGRFLKLYTNDGQLAVDIMQKLDDIYIISQDAGINLLFKIRKEAEAKLKLSEERYRVMIESVKDYSIFRLDERGYIVSWNKGAERIKGYTADEAIGKHFSIFYTKDEIARGEPSYNLNMARQKGSYETESIRVRKDGSKFWADIILTALYDNKGELNGFAKITRDVTERKENEEKIAKLNISLSQKVAELENVNKELEAFSYSVSHDLRAPLRAIHNYTQIIVHENADKLSKDSEHYMSRIMFNAKKMGQLIDDLLAFSRIGKRELQREPIDMNALVQTVISNLQTTPDTKTHFIVHDMPKPTADPGLIEMVLNNLLSNAMKYSANAERPEIEIGGKEEGNEHVFYVKDNGIGFDMRHYDKLFGVFQRLHSAEAYEGTGVGLALARRIIIRHGGRIWAESALNKGATFSFALPKI